jgi:hypothetical protein
MITSNSLDNATAIAELHGQIINSARKSLELAIQIGELLVLQKQKLKHREWGRWIEAKLPFTQRTANNYVRLCRFRDQIKLENVSNLAEAYELLAGPARMSRAEAETLSAHIQELLQVLAKDTVDFVTRLRQIRDDRVFATDYPTFESYLLHLEISLTEFEAMEQLCNALRDWMGGASAAVVFKCMGLPDGQDENEDYRSAYGAPQLLGQVVNVA